MHTVHPRAGRRGMAGAMGRLGSERCAAHEGAWPPLQGQSERWQRPPAFQTGREEGAQICSRWTCPQKGRSPGRKQPASASSTGVSSMGPGEAFAKFAAQNSGAGWCGRDQHNGKWCSEQKKTPPPGPPLPLRVRTKTRRENPLIFVNGLGVETEGHGPIF